MNSRERAVNWIACNIDNADEDHRAGMLHTLTCLLDYHEEEAKAEQREACLNRSLNNLTDVAFTAAEAVEDGCLNAVEKSADAKNPRLLE